MITEFKGEYKWLSNFSPVEIRYGGLSYPTVEHFYVAMKTEDELMRWSISLYSALEAGKVKRLGRKLKIRADWEKIKMSIMEEGLKQKFNQEPYKTLLKNTKDEYIQEGNHWKDIFWGVYLKTGNGQNNLGKLIMNIRKQINKNERR